MGNWFAIWIVAAAASLAGGARAEAPAPIHRVGAWVDLDASGSIQGVEWEHPKVTAIQAAIEPAIRALHVDAGTGGTVRRRSYLSGQLRLEPQGDDLIPHLEALRLGPKIARLTAPRYPSGALQRQRGGRVLARFVVDSEGLAKDVAIEHRNEGRVFEEAVVSALKSWRFEAEHADGEAIESEMCMPFRFSIDAKASRTKADADEEALSCPDLKHRRRLIGQDANDEEIEVTASRRWRSVRPIKN